MTNKWTFICKITTCNCICSRWRSWLRHCATSRKVAGSIPAGVVGIFRWHNPYGRTMALGSTQSLTEMNTRSISCGVKVTGAWGWQPYHLHVPIVLKSGSLNLLEPSGPVQACNGIALAFNCICPLVKSACNMQLCCSMSDTTDDISSHSHIKSTVKLSTFILSKVTATNSKPLKISQHPRSILDYSKDSVNGFLNCIRNLLVEGHVTLYTHLPL